MPLVIGLGSMGRRRIRCLQALGVEGIRGFDTNPERCQEVAALHRVPCSAWQEAFSDIDYAFISTPPDTHRFYTELLKSIPCFVEAGTQKILHGTPSATMMYHPAIYLIIDHLPKIGRMINAIYHGGQYLPDWHPYEKVKDYYVATSGAIEMVAFELTWLCGVLGFPTSQPQAMQRKTTHIEGLEAPDTVTVLSEHGGCLASLTIDVVSRVARRHLVINGSKGQLIWDWNDPCIRVWHKGKWEGVSYENGRSAEGYNTNIGEKMYLDETKAFLGTLEGESFRNSIDRNNRVMGLPDAIMRKS